MNTNKKNIDTESGWLLCPSKGIPGKFYYFNVVTGESVWSCDLDNKGIKENEQKLPNNCHKCQAPTDDGPTSSTNIPTSSTNGPTFRPYYEPKSPYLQPMPIFGQTSFPKYVPDQDLMPNIVWAPIQLPVFGETKKPLIDKVTQTLDTEKEPELNLCKSCKCHENSLSFKANENGKPLFRTSTPKKNITFEKYKETQLKHSTDPILPISPEKKVTSNVISYLSSGNKVENATNKGLNVESVLENLESTDLRFLLIAKRRKSVDAGVNGPTEKKNIFELKQPPKKRVTFNMSNIEKDDENHTNLSHVNNINTTQCNNTKDYTPKPELLKNESSVLDPQLSEIPKCFPDCVSNDTWFLVVDTDVLLLDYEIIENIVLSDSKCKLLIPYAVKSDIEGLCIGDCQGQQRVKTARQITRRLVAPPQHYIIQPCPESEDSLVSTESVLKCCVEATTSNHQVILITNDPYLQAKATLLNIRTYKLNDIKYNFNPNNPLQFINLKNSNNHEKDIENIKENSLNIEVKSQLKSINTQTYSLFDCENTNNTKSIKINETDSTVDINQITKNLKMTDINLTKTVQIKNPFINKEINSNTLFPISKIDTSKFNNVTATFVNDGYVIEKGTDFELLSLEDETFDRFTVRSEEMNEKLSSRMDEWICTYTQIMEDVLHALLQINSDCRRNTVAPLSLQETFHGIQMVYTNNTKIKTIVKKLSDLLDKCTTKNGKLILAPDDFMTILGYGIFLVQELKCIQQNSKELKDAATSMHSLLNNIESDSSEDDPERFKIAPVSRSGYDDQLEVRSNFVKDPSNVVDYLKKHYIQWAEFAENLEDEKNTCRNDYNVLRTSGKHLNKLKFDSSKNMSLNTNEEITNTPKNNKLVNQLNIKNLETGHLENLQKSYIDTNKNNENPFQYKNINCTIEKNQEKTNIKDIYNITEGPKIIRNMNKIDHYEKKIRQSLDLDALDYSEIEKTNEHENSKINEEFNNKFVINNYSDATISDIDNYLIDKQNTNLKNTENETYEISDDTSIILNFGNTVKVNREQNKPIYLKDSKINQTISKIYDSIPKTYDNSKVKQKISVIYDTIPKISQNVSKIYDNIPKINQNISKNYDTIPKIKQNISKTYDGIPNISSFYDNDSKSYHLVRDDNTNDSGFENDSTYALSTVKIYFSELCSTFRLVHRLIEKFRLIISKGELSELKKKEFRYQAGKSLEYFEVIIQHLKSIIDRESSEKTVLKGLLLKAGLEASMDKRMTHYRQVAIKFLEQAQILEIGLKAVISVTIEDFGALSTIEDSATCNYYNIFE